MAKKKKISPKLKKRLHILAEAPSHTNMNMELYDQLYRERRDELEAIQKAGREKYAYDDEEWYNLAPKVRESIANMRGYGIPESSVSGFLDELKSNPKILNQWFEDQPEAIEEAENFLRLQRDWQDISERQKKYSEEIEPTVQSIHDEIISAASIDEPEQDQTFIKEGNRIAKTLKDYDVNVTPVYDEGTIDSIFQSVKPGDEVAFLGHSGNRMFGKSLEDLGESMKQLPEGTKTYLGSCHSGNMAGTLCDSSGKPVYGTGNQSWVGPNVKGKDILSTMYGARVSQNPELGQRDISLVNAEPGMDYSFYSPDATKNISSVKRHSGQTFRLNGTSGQSGMREEALQSIMGVFGTPGDNLVPSDSLRMDFTRTTRPMERKYGGKIMTKKRKYKCGGKIRKQGGGAIGSAVGSFIPIPGASIIGGMLGTGIEELFNQDDQDNQFEPQSIIKPVNPYINARPTPMLQDGGSLTQYQGPSHEGGGIDLGIAEVEGGENEHNMVVNSDNIKLKRKDIMRYGKKFDGNVPIDKRHIGKTPAEVGDEITRRYEKFHPLDPFNVSEKESLNALSEMSEEMAEEIEIDGVPYLKKGGKWVSQAINPKYKFLKSKRGRISLTGKPLSSRHKGYRKYVDGGGLFKDPEGKFKPGTALGMAPVAANLLQYFGELGRKPEEFEYPTATEAQYEDLDPTAEIADVASGFATAQEGLRRSGKLTQAGAIQLATERGKGVGDVRSKYINLNRVGRNRNAYINQQTKMFNARQGAQSQIDSASSRGADLSRRSAFLSGAATNLGQVGRDINLASESARFNDRFLDMYEGRYGSPRSVSAEGSFGSGINVNPDEFLPIPDIGAGQNDFNMFEDEYTFPAKDKTTYANLYRKGIPYTTG